MYSYRETVPLGSTTLTKVRIDKIIQELSNEWVGTSYDLLSRNCNHFCEELCSRLGVQKVPSKSSMLFPAHYYVKCWECTSSIYYDPAHTACSSMLFPTRFRIALHAIFLRGWKLYDPQSHLPTTLSFLTSQFVRVPLLSFSPSMELNLLSGVGGCSLNRSFAQICICWFLQSWFVSTFQHILLNLELITVRRRWDGLCTSFLAHKCKTCSDTVVRLCLAAWVNRFANAGDAAVLAVGNTMKRVDS